MLPLNLIINFFFQEKSLKFVEIYVIGYFAHIVINFSQTLPPYWGNGYVEPLMQIGSSPYEMIPNGTFDPDGKVGLCLSRAACSLK